MKRWTIVLGMLLSFLFAGSLYAENKGAAAVDLKGATKNAVHFDHAKHQKLDGVTCKKCHHKDDAGKEQKCSACHNDTSAVKTKDAFHKSCQGCHKETEKAGKKSGPTMKCGDCHK